MSDPLESSAIPLVPASGMEYRINLVRMRRERAIAAARNNLVLPDVWVTDRSDCTQPVIVGQDGKELTLERRRELMAGKAPMFDEQGKATEAQYTEAFDEDIEPERIGESAERARPGIRVMPKKSLDMTPKLDIPENH